MKAGSTFTVLICLVFLIAGLYFDWRSETYNLEIENHQYAVGGQIQNAQIVTTPPDAIFDRVLSNLFYTLAISILVSVIIIKKIEDARAKAQVEELERLRAKIHEDVFSATMGKLIPEDVFSAVKFGVLENPLIVSDGVWQLQFSEENGRINLITSFLYKIKNVAESEAVVSKKIEKFVNLRSNDEGKVQSLLVKVGNQIICDYDPSGKKVGVELIDGGKTGNLSLIYSLRIPAHEVADMTLVFSDSYPSVANDIISSLFPMQKLQIVVSFPKGWQFSLESFTYSKLELELGNDTSSRFVSKGALLPNQGVNFFLTKKPNEEPKEAGAPQIGLAKT